MCEVCGKPAADDRGFCAVHLALWLRYAFLMPWRIATLEEVRAWFVRWQRGGEE